MNRITFLKSRARFKGGLEKYTHHLIRAFQEKGCAVTLLTTGEPPVMEGVQVISLAPDCKFTYLHLSRFDLLCQKWLRENPQEIVFGMERTTKQTHYRAGSGVHAVYLKRRACVDSFWKKLTFPLNPLQRKILAMEKKAFEDPDLRILFTNSSMVKEEIMSTYNTKPQKIEVVHNGVEWEKWSDPFEESLKRERSRFELLFVGNGYKRKGLLFLLQALPLIQKDFHLTVVGKDKNVPFFIDWAEKHDLKEKISFVGLQENILPYYQRADSLIIPSIYDPFANVTVEALAMGLYVVSSAYNGGSEVLKDFSGCVIENLLSTESVAAALEKAFSHPKNPVSARRIRQSIKELDFSEQLAKIVWKTLNVNPCS